MTVSDGMTVRPTGAQSRDESGAVAAIMARPLPLGADRILDAFAARVPNRDAVYLSTPMTTGHLYLEWRRQHGPSLSSSDEQYACRLKRDVLDENAARLVPLRARITEQWPDRALIDPTVLDEPAWHQRDYHRFWVEVINKLITTMVVADGWQYSTGCAIESACAFSKGIEVLDALLVPLDAERAADLLRAAAEEISHAYQSPAPTLAAAALITAG